MMHWWYGLKCSAKHPSYGKPKIHKGMKLRAIKRKTDPVEAILHESVTTTRKGALNTLKRRNLSVEFSVDRAGAIHQHMDFTKYRGVHAGKGHNAKGFGIEFINRYYGKEDHVASGEAIRAVWAHKKIYLIPTAVQCEAGWKLLKWLDMEFDSFELEFQCTRSRKFHWGRSASHIYPGVKAHHRFHHADALFFEHYMTCRDLGYTADMAWNYTLTSASSGSRDTVIPAADESHNA